MEFRPLAPVEITPSLFSEFHRHQVVTKCRRKIDGEWRIVDAPFIDGDWTAEDLNELCGLLRATVSNGGAVFGAFSDGVLKGFASVEAELFGSGGEYADLPFLHVSEDFRGQGIGRRLITLAANRARELGAKKLYISGHSAVETQAFYSAMGCVEALEYNPKHVEQERFDCQLELVL